MGSGTPITSYCCYVGNEDCTEFALWGSAKLRRINVTPSFLPSLRRAETKEKSAKDCFIVLFWEPRVNWQEIRRVQTRHASKF